MRLLGTLCYGVVALVIIVLTTVVGFVMFVFTFPFDKDRVVMHMLAYGFVWLFMKTCPLWRFEITGKEHLDKTGPCVVTANHQSMLDITLLYMALGGRHGKFVSKREVYRIPFFGWVLWARRDITIERGASGAYRKVLSQGRRFLKRGISVLIFPEGTRSKDGEIHRFKESAFALARQADVEIVPCVMNGPKWLFERGLLKRKVMQVAFMPPVSKEQIRAVEPRELAQMVQKMSEEKLAELRKD